MPACGSARSAPSDAAIRFLPDRMRLRRFHDATLQGAMAQLRSALGPDALILQTVRVRGGIEVTAALDQPEPPPPPRRPRDAVPAEPEQARLRQLDWHGVPFPLARRLRAGPLAFALSLTVRFAGLDPSAAPLLLAGPPGAGKTLTIVRLATRLVMTGQRPVVLCADTGRAGAAEQLAAFTRLLGVELLEVGGPAEARRCLRDRAGAGPVLIDMQGADPWDAESRDGVSGLAQAARARLVAVLPAGLDPAEAADLAGGFAELGADALIATRLDVARRLGGVLSAAATGLAFTEIGVGPGAADGLVPATAEAIARRLLAPLPPARPREDVA